MKRIVISDTHIGSKYYKEEELISFLSTVEYDQLILNGDIIELLKMPEFSNRIKDLVNAINFSKEIIYVVGNHDVSLQGFIGQTIFGIKFVDKYEFEVDGKKFRIEHGDQYDEHLSLVQNRVFMSFLSLAQHHLEKWLDIDLSGWFTQWRFKRRKLLRIWDILNSNLDVDVVICGHFHIPECIIWVQADETVKTYANSGDWVSHSTYIQIEGDDVRLKEWKNGNTDN